MTVEREPSETNEAYAWGKTALFLLEPHLQETYNQTRGPYSVVDVGSAFPWLPQILRENRRRECLGKATHAVGQLVKSLQAPQYRLPTNLQVPYFDCLDEQTQATIRQQFSPRHSAVRQVVTGVVFDLLSNPLPELTSAAEARVEHVARTLFDSCVTSRTICQNIFEREQYIGKGRWEIITEGSTDFTVEKYLRMMVGDNDLQLLRDMTSMLADHIAPDVRRYNVFSLDIEDPKSLRHKARTSFPVDYQNTLLYARAASMHNHIRADGMRLPFAEASVSMMYSVEGIPFWLNPDEYSPEDYVEFARSVEHLLVSGGRAVFFPWKSHFEQEDSQNIIAAIERKWRESPNLTVVKQSFSRDNLIGGMMPREIQLVTSGASPIFTRGDEDLTLLILEKKTFK